MRFAAIGLLLGASLLAAVVSLQRSDAYAQPPGTVAPFPASDQLIALTSDAHERHQQVTLVDPKTRVMAVYHIDRTTGQATLKSVRSVHWDLLMEEFNSVSPTPREIKSLYEQR